MTDIIKIIYNDMLSESVSYHECKDLYKRDEKLWDKVRPLLNQDTIEELQGSQDAILFHSNLEWFRQGIRTGMSLMTELL